MDLDMGPERLIGSSQDEEHDDGAITESVSLECWAHSPIDERLGAPIEHGAGFRPGFLVDWPVVTAGDSRSGARSDGGAKRGSGTRSGNPLERRRRRRSEEHESGSMHVAEEH